MCKKYFGCVLSTNENMCIVQSWERMCMMWFQIWRLFVFEGTTITIYITSNNHMKTSQMVNFNKVHAFRDTQACKKNLLRVYYSLRLLLFSQGTPNTVIIRCFSVSSPNVWNINNAVSFINVSGVSSTFTQNIEIKSNACF